MTVGLLGGTFDPIHHGHLRLALECAAAVGCSETRLIPALQPPHRPAPVATPAQRLRMAELSIAGDSQLRVDDCELRRGGQSFTVDTLETLRRTVSGPLCLFLGADAFAGLRTWRHWERIIELAHLVVATRPGVAPGSGDVALTQFEAQHRVEGSELLRDRAAGCILHVAVPALDISSTRIRQLLAEGRTVRYLVPDPVINFIQQEGLYRNQT